MNNNWSTIVLHAGGCGKVRAGIGYPLKSTPSCTCSVFLYFVDARRRTRRGWYAVGVLNNCQRTRGAIIYCSYGSHYLLKKKIKNSFTKDFVTNVVCFRLVRIMTVIIIQCKPRGRTRIHTHTRVSRPNYALLSGLACLSSRGLFGRLGDERYKPRKRIPTEPVVTGRMVQGSLSAPIPKRKLKIDGSIVSIHWRENIFFVCFG